MNRGMDDYGRRVYPHGIDETLIQARHLRPGDVVLGDKDRYGRDCRRGIIETVNHHRPNDGSGQTIVVVNYKFARLGEAFMPGNNVVVRAPRHWTGRKVVFTMA